MLKHRLITAAILIPLIIVAIWFLSVWSFAALAAALVVLSAWEWASFLMWKSIFARSAYTMLVLGALIGALYSPVNQVLLAGFVVWAWAALAVISGARGRSPLGFQNQFVKGLMGMVMLPVFWVSLNVLRASMLGPFWLLFALVLVWSVDTGAYAAGRLWGKRYLAPRLSPRKTWEGFGGGIILALLIAVAAMFLFSATLHQSVGLLVLTLITALFAVVGDLLESLFKRQADLKDSGCLLPGHGGLLDRIDGLLAALPLFALGSLFLGY